MRQQWPWFALALLGAYHGLNPGMGWLYALSLGLQEKSQKAVVRALLPIGLGHAVASSLASLSFLMASTQGAGLMLAPILLARPTLGMSPRVDAGAAAMRALSTRVLALAVSVHPLG